MKFTHYKLGHVAGGAVVEVSLRGSAANVRLMDQSNFNNFKAGRQHRYHGGLIRRSPFRIRVPRSGTWHVTVDMQGLRGTVRSEIRVIPPEALKPLPPVNEASLRDVPSLVRNVALEQVPGVDAPDDRVFDVFISHTSEDKTDVVRPLATALRDAGLSVWYDEFELKIGDSLRRKIDKGLANSRFGVVVLSRAFFRTRLARIRAGWPRDPHGIGGEQVLLPVWHNVTKHEVMEFSPSLADRVARSTATHTVEEIAAEIVDVIRNPPEG